MEGVVAIGAVSTGWKVWCSCDVCGTGVGLTLCLLHGIITKKSDFVNTDGTRMLEVTCGSLFLARENGGIPMDRQYRAAKLFFEGYNCAQAVAMAFADLVGLDEKFCAKAISSFGGGMGRLREVCGAVSGMLFIAGLLYGYDTKDDDKAKKEHYARVQELAGKFREEVGSIVCREILKNPPSDPNPTPRTEQYYKDRPCAHMVTTAVRIMEEYIAEHPL